MFLIIGGSSTIGRSLANYWRGENIPFHASIRQEEFESEKTPFIDLSKPKTFESLLAYESILLCAAVTNVMLCERDPLQTWAINVTATIKLLEKIALNKTHIVFISTNQVFDGKKPQQGPKAHRSPITEYGRQKLEVEKYIENISNSCILRLSKVVHPKLNLLNKWKISLAGGSPIFAFTDMTLSPIDIDKVVKKIDILVMQKATGIFQLSGDRDISYFEYAQEFAESNGYSRDLVKKDSWQGKLDFTPPPLFTSLMNV